MRDVRVRSLALVALASAAVACSESPPASTPTPDASVKDVGGGDTGAVDVAVSDTGSMDVSVTDTFVTDTPVTDTFPTDAGTPDAGPPPCPLYQARCNGVCIPTSVDPNNCGGCGVRCSAGQACSGGACSDRCLPGLSICAGSCVDLQSDSRHCGVCGTTCAMGEGCVAGRCVRAAILDPTGFTCTNGGAPVDLGGSRCAGSLAETTFRWAICSCRDLSMSARLVTDGFDSTRGPYTPGGLGAGVGTNGSFSNSAPSDVGGALWIAATTGWGLASPHTVRQVLRVNGNVQTSSTLTASDEAYVNGDVRTSSMVRVTGALHIPDGATVQGDVTYARLTREPVRVTAPCDCDPASFVPIASFVEEARTRNDNARLGLDADALASINTPTRIDLPCGRFYLSRIGSSAPVTIVAHGRAALFIGGDISMSQRLTITLDPTAELDVVVGGSIGVSAPLTLGSPNYPALTRVYIGSTRGFNVSSESTLGANFYVPNGPIGTSSALEVYGGVFTQNLSASSTVSVHYDRAVLRAGEGCRTPTTPVPGDGGVSTDAGPPRDAGSGMCTSCRDCANQACVGGRCGACMSDADCCAPLQCWMGRCVVIPG